MSKSSFLSSKSNLRRQPQQQRGQQRVAKILLAAAEVFVTRGYGAATIQQIADQADTAVGSIYQFFPDKAAIFQALLTEHWQQIIIIEDRFFASDLHRPLRNLIDDYIDAYSSYFEHPIPRSITLQEYLQPIPGVSDCLQESLVQFTTLFQRHGDFYRQRNPALSIDKSELLIEIARQTISSLVILAINSNISRRPVIYAEIKDVLFGYLDPHIGDRFLTLQNNTMHNNLMICPHCQSDRLAKNGRQQGKQRYICRICGRQFSDRYTPRGYPLETKQQCLALHRQGVSFREIERQTGISHNTVINWVRHV
jgi:AcrR family transcriptional regulator